MSLSHKELTKISRELQRLDEDQWDYWAQFDIAVEQRDKAEQARTLNGVYSTVERRLQIMTQFE